MTQENTLLIVGLGVGAYLLLTSQARAGQRPYTPLNATPASTLFARQNRSVSNPAASAGAIYSAATINAAGQLGSLVNKWFGGSSTPPPSANRQYSPFEADYPGSSTADGIAANPAQDTSVNAFDPYGYGDA